MVGGDGGVRRTPSAGTRGPPSTRSTTTTASRRTTMTPSTAAPTATATGEAYDRGLEHFFLQDTSTIGQRRRTTGARSVATTTTRSRQRPRQCATPAAMLSKKKSSRTPPRRRHHRESSTEEAEAEEEDTRSFDLDLATARETFQQQHVVHEQLQLHLTKTDELLYSVFPKHVAETLRNGHKVAPENHDRVTIYFSDIVGFTDISSQLDPLEISDLLDRLYNSFDALSEYHDVFKVETIGDA